MQLFLEQTLNGLAIGSIYALIALGLALIYGVMRILHVAHAAVFTVGAYAGLYFFTLSGSLLLALVGSIILCSVLGVLIERFIYYPLLNYPPYVPLISSIALFIGAEELCRLIAGPDVLAFPAEIPFPSFTVAGVTVSSPLVAVYVVTASILLALWFLSSKTEFGLGLRAASQDMEIASSLGVNSHRMISSAFVIGSSIAAVAGILVGIYYNQVYPTMGAVPAYKSMALIVVGGMGSVPGAVIASILLGIGETFLIGFTNIPVPRDALAFIVMIAVLLWRPSGLFGKR